LLDLVGDRGELLVERANHTRCRVALTVEQPDLFGQVVGPRLQRGHPSLQLLALASPAPASR
jgi:hypothetical protein